MHLRFRNVNDAFRGLVQGLHDGTIPTHVCASRAGEVAMIEEPVIVTYSNPRERVLFNTARDANPFFHLYESLWMIAGRNDVAPLAYYNSKIAEIASDDGKMFNGAYGWRWRKSVTFEEREGYPEKGIFSGFNVTQTDQLKILIDHLKHKPESRRAILQMWNVEDDLLKIDGNECGACKGTGKIDDDYCRICRGTGGVKPSKDVCCNLSICFWIGQGNCLNCWEGNIKIDSADPFKREMQTCPKCSGMFHDQSRFLNMTVFNRSNDLIWGALGANVVHFSILQEYMAAHLGLEVGVYNQISNNLHYYTERWEDEKWLKEYEPTDDNPIDGLSFPHSRKTIPYEYLVESGKPNLVPLIKDPTVFDRELPEFVERHSRDAVAKEYQEPFLQQTAQIMCLAYHYYKRREFHEARFVANEIAADDWRQAATQWIERRRERSVSKAMGAP